MGIVFIMFAELWVPFFRHVRNYGSNILTKMARPRPKLGSVTPRAPFTQSKEGIEIEIGTAVFGIKIPNT